MISMVSWEVSTSKKSFMVKYPMDVMKFLQLLMLVSLYMSYMRGPSVLYIYFQWSKYLIFREGEDEEYLLRRVVYICGDNLIPQKLVLYAIQR